MSERHREHRHHSSCFHLKLLLYCTIISCKTAWLSCANIKILYVGGVVAFTVALKCITYVYIFFLLFFAYRNSMMISLTQHIYMHAHFVCINKSIIKINKFISFFLQAFTSLVSSFLIRYKWLISRFTPLFFSVFMPRFSYFSLTFRKNNIENYKMKLQSHKKWGLCHTLKALLKVLLIHKTKLIVQHHLTRNK